MLTLLYITVLVYWCIHRFKTGNTAKTVATKIIISCDKKYNIYISVAVSY